MWRNASAEILPALAVHERLSNSQEMAWNQRATRGLRHASRLDGFRLDPAVTILTRR
jgi:hypothetical protein